MKSLVIGAIAALALGGIGQPARAADANFALFKRVCIDTHADRAAIMAAAAKEGISHQTPPEVLAKIGAGMSDVDGHDLLTPNGITLVLVGRRTTHVGDGDFTTSMCLFAVAPPATAAEGEAMRWAGVPPTPSDDGTPLMTFTGEPGHHVAVDSHDRAKYVDLARKGLLQALSAKHNDSLTILIYGLLTGE